MEEKKLENLNWGGGWWDTPLKLIWVQVKLFTSYFFEEIPFDLPYTARCEAHQDVVTDQPKLCYYLTLKIHKKFISDYYSLFN